jgi:hypothetical protein
MSYAREDIVFERKTLAVKIAPLGALAAALLALSAASATARTTVTGPITAAGAAGKTIAAPIG